MTRWIAILLLLCCATASGAGTRRKVLDRNEFAAGERQDLMLDVDGALRVSPQRATTLPLQANYVWSMARDTRGRLVLGSGDTGLLFREADAQYVRWADTLALEILSLLADGQRMLAGSSPDGIVYAIDGDGRVEVALDLPLQSIWDLAKAEGGFFAAAGPGAQIVRVNAAAPAGEMWAELPAANALHLLRQGDALWIGTDSPALVLRAASEDSSTLRTLFAAPEQEIRALVSDGEAGVYALSLDLGGDAAKSTSRITWISADGASETIFLGEQRLLDLERLPDGTLLAADAKDRNLLRIDRAGRAAVWYSLEQADPVRLHVESDGRVFVGTANLASLIELRSGEVERGQFTSEVIATPNAASYGRVDAWPFDREIQFELRSGVRPEPDASWSEWSEPAALGSIARAVAAPYVQLRVTQPHSAAPLSELVLHYRERNLPPRVSDFVIEPAGGAMQRGAAGASPGQISQTFADGISVEFSLQAPVAPASPELASWARGLRVLKWKSEDPNGDALRHRIEIARWPDGDWSLLTASQTLSPFAWDTRLWPDGSYRLRVAASDAAANSPGEAREGAAVSAPVHVDNTPPRIEDGELSRGRLRAKLLDDASPLVDLAWQIDDGDWQPLDVVDGILDSREEMLDVLAPTRSAPAQLRLRLSDAAGNVRLAEFALRGE